MSRLNLHALKEPLLNRLLRCAITSLIVLGAIAIGLVLIPIMWFIAGDIV